MCIGVAGAVRAYRFCLVLYCFLFFDRRFVVYSRWLVLYCDRRLCRCYRCRCAGVADVADVADCLSMQAGVSVVEAVGSFSAPLLQLTFFVDGAVVDGAVVDGAVVVVVAVAVSRSTLFC